MAAHRIDLTGQRFGKLLALQESGINGNRTVLWQCRCDCGNERAVSSSALRIGQATHCGCLTGAHISEGKNAQRNYRTQWMARKRAAQKIAKRKAALRDSIRRPNNGPLDVFLYAYRAAP